MKFPKNRLARAVLPLLDSETTVNEPLSLVNLAFDMINQSEFVDFNSIITSYEESCIDRSTEILEGDSSFETD